MRPLHDRRDAPLPIAGTEDLDPVCGSGAGRADAMAGTDDAARTDLRCPRRIAGNAGRLLPLRTLAVKAPVVGRSVRHQQFGGNPMQDGLSAPVIGPSAILPRGYLWLAPIWYLIAAMALALSPWPPMWFRITAAAGLFTAMLVFVLV